MHRAVHRLHRRVREKRLLVGRLDLARGSCDCRRSITIVARDRTWLLHSASKLSDDVGRGELSIGARVPLRSCRGEPLLGRPSVRRDDSHRVGEADNLAHPGHGHRLCLIHGRELSAERGRNRQHRELHPWQANIDAEVRAAIDLAGEVEAPMGGSQQFEVRGRLESDLLGHRELCRRVRQLSVAKLAAARGMHDRAVFPYAGRRVHVPPPCGRRLQHHPCGSTRAAQRNVHRSNGGRAAGHLQADERIGVDLVVRRRVFDRHLVDIHLELLGDQHRQRGIGSLAHLDHRHDESHPACAIDSQEGVRRERSAGGQGVAHLGERGQAKAELQPPTGGARRGDLEKIPARSLHFAPPAFLIAARMRGYVPQRQMFPAMT